MPLKVGSTILLPIKLEWKDHLWILLTDADAEGKTLMVNLTTAKPHSIDRTTVLHVGDHPFISRDSVINYMDAKLPDVSKLNQAISMGLAEQKDDASLKLLTEARNGLLNSSHTKNSIKDYLRAQMGC